MGQNQTLTAAMVTLHWNVQHLLQQRQDYAGLMTEFNRKQAEVILNQERLIRKLKRSNVISLDNGETMEDVVEPPTSDQTAAAAAAPTAAAAAPTSEHLGTWTFEEGAVESC